MFFFLHFCGYSFSILSLYAVRMVYVYRKVADTIEIESGIGIISHIINLNDFNNRMKIVAIDTTLFKMEPNYVIFEYIFKLSL